MVIRRIKRAVQRQTAEYLARLDRKRKLYVCPVRKYEVTLWVESAIERFRAKTYSTKEPETLDWIERYVQPGDVMYDVGANIGLYAIFAAKRMDGRGKVYAFEPEALNHAKLSVNIHLNGLSGVIVPCCLALTDKLCFDTFYLHPNNFKVMTSNQLAPGSALHSFGVTNDYSGESFRPFHTQGTVGVPLDYLWENWGLEFPNHIKIDVDGLEEKIIDGAPRTLKDRRLKSVLIEISSKKGSTNPILQRLARAGFAQVKDFAAHSREQLKGTPFEDSVNCIFVRES